ncbi:DMT family transporter [Cohnella kolymensis]|uniref:DMT family transporter n=1 Tax=Cohnella kolymensis TaxID=1590652 RepID=UPI001F1E3E6B|nr:DMT family transporter [Cohnella kolymensis]
MKIVKGYTRIMLLEQNMFSIEQTSYQEEGSSCRVSFILLSFCSVSFGAVLFYFIKVLLNDFGPWTIAFLRSGAGLVVVVVIMLAFRKPFNLRMIPWIPMAAMALINTAIPWAFIGFSETRLTSSMASILNATTPVWTIFIGMLFFKNVSTKMQWLGISIASFGLIVLLGVNSETIISVDVIGFIGMLTASLCYGIGSQLSKRLLSGYSMYQITFGTLLTCMISSGSMAFATETVSYSDLISVSNIPMIIGLGAFGSGIAYILFYYIIQNGSAEFATMVTYLVPCTALIWGYSLLNEEITWSLITGLFIVLGGVFIAGRKPRTVKAASMEQLAE